MRSFAYAFFIFSGLVLAILSIRARKQGRIQVIPCKENKKEDIFEVIAWYVYQIICVRLLSGNQKSSFIESILQAPQVKRDLRALNPQMRVEVLQAKYYVQKIKWFLVILFAGNILALVVHISSFGNGMIYENRYIERNSGGEGQKTVCAWVETEDGIWGEEVEIHVEETALSEEELETLYGKAVAELETLVPGEGKLRQKINESIVLPGSLEGYPFELEWESNNYSLMSHEGEIWAEEIDEEGESVQLICHFKYREWQKDHELWLTIFPKEKTEEEKWQELVQNALTSSAKEQEKAKTYILPDEIGGRKVIWKELKEDYSLVLLILLSVTACCIYIFQDRDLHKKTEERDAQMLAEYPVLVNRLTLYLGAGMTIKSAWDKIAKDYRERKSLLGEKNYTYEEMLFTCYEMQSGISEYNAYEKFGKRCGLQPYIRLVGFLNQSLKKGNSALLNDLQKESEAAQEERRNQARKKGEEAGTKLLLPMMMMLAIVMVLVMVPAFFSFSI